MSQTSVSRVAPRPLRPASRPAPERPLRLVSGQGAARGSTWFVALCAVISVGALLAVLLVNTVMAQGAFALNDLQVRAAQLSAEQEALTNEIDAQKAPARLAQRASRLGMVPGESAAFVDVRQRKVIGVAQPAVKDPAFSVNTSPTVR